MNRNNNKSCNCHCCWYYSHCHYYYYYSCCYYYYYCYYYYDYDYDYDYHYDYDYDYDYDDDCYYYYYRLKCMSCVRKGFACHTLGGRCLIFSWITRSHQSLDPSNLRSSTKRRIPKSPRVSFTNAKISTPTDFSASSGFCFAAAETVPEAPQSVACSSPYKHAQHVGPGTTAQRASVRTFMPACRGACRGWVRVCVRAW